jgi:hypothetical protein
MPGAFGFSVGDFISGISLIRDLIKSLEEGAGSGQEYRDLIRELYELERALLEIKHIRVPEALTCQKNALEQAACQCQETISDFLLKTGKYSRHLSSRGSGNVMGDALRKMQWVLCTKDDIKIFRAKIAGHKSSLLMLLATLQL